MTGPILWIKKRWYRRQAKRALWFMRYMDLVAHGAGWGRTKTRQMWRDFAEHPWARFQILDKLAAANKVEIRRARKLLAEKRLEDMSIKYHVAMAELRKAKAEAQAAAGKPAEVVEAIVPKAEEIHEVPAV